MILCFLVLYIVVQEYGFSPVKRSTKQLAKDGFLPSKLSKVDSFELGYGMDSCKTDVHYLHAKGVDGGKIDAVYCNHGFGASSIVWQPVLRLLAKGLQVPHVLSHDAVGFGLTSRPPVNSIRDLHRYGFSFSAGIGMALLGRTLSFYSRRNLFQKKCIVLVGHSMGSLTTLRMALELPRTTRVNVVLVAPAVVGLNPNESPVAFMTFQPIFKTLITLWSVLFTFCLPILRRFRIVFVDPPCYFILKRIIA